MRQQMEARLAALKSEYDKGQAQLRQLESQAGSLRETMLRISGAIMVLEELLSPAASATSANPRQSAEMSTQPDPSASAGNDGHAAINKQ